jgi:hypothetical protein
MPGTGSRWVTVGHPRPGGSSRVGLQAWATAVRKPSDDATMRSRTTSRCPSFSRYPRSGAPPLPAPRPAVGEAVPYEDLRRAAFPARTRGCRRRQDPRISNGRVERYRGVAAQPSGGEPARPPLPGTSSRRVLAHSWWPPTSPGREMASVLSIEREGATAPRLRRSAGTSGGNPWQPRITARRLAEQSAPIDCEVFRKPWFKGEPRAQR